MAKKSRKKKVPTGKPGSPSRQHPQGDGKRPPSLIQQLTAHQGALFLGLTLLTGMIVFGPHTDYHGYMAPGDHGRDFYAYQQTMQGKVPYQDYWWVYGPLMPYFYAISLKILGISVSSILVAKSFLQMGAGLLLYLGLRSIIHPAFAYLGAAWFWVFHEGFFFTHNHAGGILLIIGCVYGLLRYIRRSHVQDLWWALACAFILSFVKVNFGLTALVAVVSSTFIVDFSNKENPTRSKKVFYVLAILGAPLLIAEVYWLFLRGLTSYEIRQCLPYFDADHPYNTSVFTALGILAQGTWNQATSSWANISFGLLVTGSAVRTAHSLMTRKLTSSTRKTIGLSLIILAILYAGNLHEFIKSGVWYRTVWAQPLGVMLSFIVIDTAWSAWSKRWHTGAWIVIFCLMSWGFYGKASTVREAKSADHFLAHPKAEVYLNNSDHWIQTVLETTSFLTRNLKEDELFFALPYEPLYYYLTDRESPTRQLIFFDHINIPEEQEEKIIAELSEKNVDYILISSRQSSSEPGLGILGQTYCPLIATYIGENFQQIAQFGDWENPAGWAWNHGTAIWKRR